MDKERHERDNVIINESIETFISFIDAKDPYTNGHSLRVAKYTRRIAEEFEIIKSHTVRGGAILSHFKSLDNAGEGALFHHERYDGKGYPEGESGEDIPFIARMICVADSYDAMNTDRVYRKKLSKESIIEEIEKGKGTQFDPKIADVMLYLIQNDQLNLD